VRPDRIVIHYGEIGLKGRNRPDFERRLQRNLGTRLEALGLEWPVRRAHDRLLVEVGEGALEPALEAIAEVAGVVWFAPAVFLPLGDEASAEDRLEARIVAQAGACADPAGAFAVRVHRAFKGYPQSSQALERRLGAAILRDTPWRRVDLTRPHRTFHVDVYREGFYLYDERRRGPGGLPVGASGRVLALLSGGIDSPVAAWLMAKRGCHVDCLHFAASLMQQRQALDYKVSRLVARLSRRTLRTRLYLVPYVHFELSELARSADYELVVFRRFMAATAEALAKRVGAQALVAGDNIGQVASQTLENLASVSRAVSMPILRPLLTYDKQEIVDLARTLGTFDLSIEPYKDCCSILSRHARTRSRHEALAELEARLAPDYAALVDRTLGDAVVIEYACGERVAYTETMGLT